MQSRTSARRTRRRWRLIAAWAVSAALVASYYLVADTEADAPPVAPAIVAEGEETDLDIVEAVPNEATPGSAIELRFVGGDQRAEAPAFRVEISQSQHDRYKANAEVLHRQDDRLFVRIPKEAKFGAAKLRLYQGETRSKPYDVRIEPLNRRKLFRSVIGGLALLVFGLHTLSTGSRAYAGQRSQGIFARIARRPPAAVALGMVVGGVTQFTTTAAGLVVGLVESHLLAIVPAVAVLIGAQLGAAATPSILGLAATKEGLLVVAIGVIWTSMSVDRRSRAFGKIILGCGLLFYGLSILRVGFEPLVADPEMIPYIDLFHAETLPGLLTCTGAGVLLAAALQGPAPVFVLVLGLAQASGHLDVQSALAILAGTGLGGAIGTLVVAWPFGPASRRLARTHFALALIGTLILMTTIDAWAFVADTLVSGRPEEVDYGKKVLLPNIGRHLVVGFAASQIAITILLASVLPLVSRILQRTARPAPSRGPGALLGSAGVAALRSGLARVLDHHRQALEAINELCTTGHRARGTDGEHALADARGELENLFSGAMRSRSNEPEMARLRQAALATLQMQRAAEDLLRHAERTTEANMALSPAGQGWQLAASDGAAFKSLHELLLGGIQALKDQLERGLPPDLDAARSREIRLNALEMDTRQALLHDADRGEEATAIALRLNTTDLVNAYENFGNHLYRLSDALAAEVEQDAAE